MYIKKALHGTALIFLFSIIAALFGYLLRMLLARQLSVAEFGLFYSVMTLFLFISYIIDSGINFSLSKKIIELRLKGKTSSLNDIVMSVLSIQFIVTVAISLMIIILGNYLSANYFHANASLLLYLGAIWILFTPMLLTYGGIYFGFQKPYYSSLLELVRSLLVLIFTLVMLYLGFDYLSPAIAQIIGVLIVVAIFFFSIRKVFPQFSIVNFKFQMKNAMKILPFGLMIGLSNLIWLIVLQIDTLLITYFMSPESVGIYQIAVTLAYLLMYVASSLSSVLYPLLSELEYLKHNEKLKQALQLVYKYLLVVLVPAVILIYSFPEAFINILFTARYAQAANPLMILSIFTIFCSITLINNIVLTSINKPKTVLTMMVFVALTNVILNLLMIPRYGLMGAAYSTLASFILAAAISTYLVKKSTDVKFPARESAILVLISFVLVFEAMKLSAILKLPMLLQLLVCASIIGITYILLIFSLRVISVSEITFFIKTFFKR